MSDIATPRSDLVENECSSLPDHKDFRDAMRLARRLERELFVAEEALKRIASGTEKAGVFVMSDITAQSVLARLAEMRKPPKRTLAKRRRRGDEIRHNAEREVRT